MIKFLLTFFSSTKWGLTLGNLYSYITFRSLLALIISFVLVLIFGHKSILWLNRKKYKDTSGDFLSISVSSKRGTPTAGGILIIIATLISTVLLNDLKNHMVHLLLASIIFFGLVGYWDDVNKIRKKSSIKGLSQTQKTIGLLLFIVPVAFYLTGESSPIPVAIRTSLFVPFYKHSLFDAGRIAYSLFLVFFFFAIVNSVNITDGQDGLASGLSAFVIGVYCFLAYITGNQILSSHYYYPFIPNAAEVAVFGAALIGATIGFLWFNTYPAEVFMGDTGSLAIGGSIALIAMLIKQEVLFLIIGGVFVLEITTSLLQEKVGDRIGRRIFHRAPYHYTLTHKGIAETKAVMRFLLIGLMLAAIGILSVKIR